jgi:uncharacterized repeat protein (TIGR01451 family)
MLSSSLLTGLPQWTRASAPASDTASNAVYNTGWTNLSNGGSGWAAGWQLVRSTNDAALAGFVATNSAINAGGGSGDINTGGRSWGVYAASGQTAFGIRQFNGDLIIGQTFSVDIDISDLGVGGRAGMSLGNAGNSAEFSVYATNGVIWVHDADGDVDTGIAVVGQGLRVSFTRQNTTDYSLIIEEIGLGVYPALLRKLAAGVVLDRVRLFTIGTGSETNFFNNLAIGPCGVNCAITPTSGTDCVNGQNGFSGPAGRDSYSWILTANTSGASFAGAANQQTVTVNNGATAGSYTLTLTNSVSGCTNSCSTTITVSSGLSITASNSSPVCAGQDVTLFTFGAPVGSSFSWVGPNFSSSLQNPTVAKAQPANAGTYTVYVTASGCSASTSTVVTVNSLPAVTAQNNGPVCVGQTLALTANGAGVVGWWWTFPDGRNSNLQNPTVTNVQTSAAGIYTVVGTNAAGCVSAPATTQVTVNATPAAPTVSNNGPICAGRTLNLSATAGDAIGWRWNGPNGFTSVEQNPAITNVQPTASGTYSVTYTNGAGCASSIGSTSVTINDIPQAVAANNSPVCTGGKLLLSVQGDPTDTFQWTGPNSFTSNLQNPSVENVTTNASGWYRVQRTVQGCASTVSSTLVTVVAAPVVKAGNNRPCLGSDLVIFADVLSGETGTFEWTGPRGYMTNVQSAVVTSNAKTNFTGQYCVTFTATSGCSTQVCTDVFVRDLPLTTASANVSNICVGGTLRLFASGDSGDLYSWSSTFGFTSTNQNPVIESVPSNWDNSDPTANVGTTNFFYVVRTLEGCSSPTSTVRVIVHPLPPCVVTGPDDLCARYYGEIPYPFEATSIKGATYSWAIDGDPNNPVAKIADTRTQRLVNIVALQPGEFTLTVDVQSQAGCVSRCTKKVTVWDSPILPTAPLPNAVVGAPYNYQIEVVGNPREQDLPPGLGTEPYTFTALGGLPPGLTLDQETGLLSGTFTREGTYAFSVKVEDSSPTPCADVANYTINVGCQNLTLLPPKMPRGFVGQVYNQAIVVAAHTNEPTTFIRSAGALPPGVSLINTNIPGIGYAGLLVGVPTAFGTFNFKIAGIDDTWNCIGQQSFVIYVGCPENMTVYAEYPEGNIITGNLPTSLPRGEIRKFYPNPFDTNSVLQLIGMYGTPPYTFVPTGGSLPAGLTLTSDGKISGIPTSGSSVFVVTVVDANGCQTNRSYTILTELTCPEITIAPGALPGGTVGQTYNQLLTASGGTGASAFAVTAGALPAGLTVNPSGQLNGVPQAAGSFNFIVTSADTEGCTASRSYSLTICPAITVTPSTLPPGIVGAAYNQTLTASGSTAPYTFTVGGVLPAGLTLTTGGVLSGTPTADGTNSFTVTVTSATGCATTKSYSLVVITQADLALSMTALPAPVFVGSNLTYTLTITNMGPSAASAVTVTDVLPVNSTFVSASSGCTASNGVVVCDVGALASGGSAALTIVVNASVTGVLTNLAGVVAAETDPNLTNNAAAATTEVAVGAVAFTAPGVLVSGDSAYAVLEVSRTGDSSGTMSVKYATADDTAVAGVDYVAASGTLGFAPGILTRSLTVPILPSGAVGSKSARVNLHTPTGGAALGSVQVTKLTIVRTGKSKTVTLKDVDGDDVTVQLTGNGDMVVSLVNGDSGPIDQIALSDTDQTSVLKVKVRRAEGGDGLVDVGQVVGVGGLQIFNARGVNLVNGGISLGGMLGNVRVNALRQADIVSSVSIGTVRMVAMEDAMIAAGFTPTNLDDPMAGGAFAPAGVIRSVGAAKFARSVVVASSVGSVKFGLANVDGGGKQCGVLAVGKISAVSLKSPAFHWNRNGADDQWTGDFHVRHSSASGAGSVQ